MVRICFMVLLQKNERFENVSHYLGVVGNVYRQSFVYGWQEAFNSLGQKLWIIPTLGSILLVGAVTVYLTRFSQANMFPSRRQLGTWLVGGLLFHSAFNWRSHVVGNVSARSMAHVHIRTHWRCSGRDKLFALDLVIDQEVPSSAGYLHLPLPAAYVSGCFSALCAA